MITIFSKKQYLPRYLLFSVIFTVLLLIFAAIGLWLASDFNTSEEAFVASDSHTIIIIDPGHGGEDGGAIGSNGIYEKDINLAIAKQLNDMLRAAGISTVLTRSEDILLYDPTSDYHGQKKVQDLSARREIAESYENAIFVSIHMNAFPEEKYSGLQVYYSPNNPRAKSLAQHIQATTKELLLPNNSRSIKRADQNIYLLDRLQCPAVLIECGFLSNPQECENLSDQDYQQKMALAICLSILNEISENGS